MKFEKFINKISKTIKMLLYDYKLCFNSDFLYSLVITLLFIAIFYNQLNISIFLLQIMTIFSLHHK